jgi:hypothetical protein
MEAVYSLKD